MAFLSWQLAVTRTELTNAVEQELFYKNRLETYYRDWEEIQFGLWEKLKVNGHYVFLGVNDTYVENYLRPNGMAEIDIIGKSNIELFGEQVGGSWRTNDSIVAYTGVQTNAVELVQYGDWVGSVFISKWRKIRRNGDTTVVGMAISLDTIQSKYIKSLKSRPRAMNPILKKKK